LDVAEDGSGFGQEIERVSGNIINAEIEPGVEKPSGYSWWVLLVLAAGGIATLLWVMILAQVAFQFVQLVFGWALA
jgi:hypothetical protein